MRDVSFKPTTRRTALAQAVIVASRESLDAIRARTVPKGDPLEIAKAAAVMAAKKTAEWIPYCHNIPIEFVGVEYALGDVDVTVRVRVTSVAKTGVEMEAMTAASAAALTVYDMLKMIDDAVEIRSVRLLEKRGGKSDAPRAEGWPACVIVCSDRAASGEYEDRSGKVLIDGLRGHGATDVRYALLPDGSADLGALLGELVDEGRHLTVIVGGSGVGPRDLTPEIVTPLLEMRLPGVEEAFRSYGQARLPTAMLSRCVAGVLRRMVVVALPGSQAACEDALAALFPGLLHAFTMVRGGGHP